MFIVFVFFLLIYSEKVYIHPSHIQQGLCRTFLAPCSYLNSFFQSIFNQIQISYCFSSIWSCRITTYASSRNIIIFSPFFSPPWENLKLEIKMLLWIQISYLETEEFKPSSAIIGGIQNCRKLKISYFWFHICIPIFESILDMQ